MEPADVLESNTAQILAKWSELCGLGRRTLLLAFEIGELLISAQATVKGHKGLNWEQYVRETLKIEPRTARNYMTLSKERDLLEKSANIAELGIVAALELIRSKKTGSSDEQDTEEEPDSPSDGASAPASDEAELPEGEKEESPPPFELAGDAMLGVDEVKWTHGIIDRNQLDEALTPWRWSNFEVDTNRKSEFQTLLIQIAAPINAAFPESTKKDAEHARRVIEKLLRMLDKIEHPEKKKKN